MVNLYQNLFPFQEIGDALTGWSKELKWRDDGFSWQTPLGESELTFQPASVVTLDKLTIVGFVITKHQLSMDDNDVFTVENNKKRTPTLVRMRFALILQKYVTLFNTLHNN